MAADHWFTWDTLPDDETDYILFGRGARRGWPAARLPRGRRRRARGRLVLRMLALVGAALAAGWLYAEVCILVTEVTR